MITFVFGCTFEESLAPELIMKRVKEGNIPPHGTIRFALSEPVVNDYIELAFSPDHGVGYHTYLTPDRDTLVLDISGMLPGKTTYIISPASKITAESGGEIEPFGVSFTATSYPTEDIGNNDSSTATPFEQPMYGSLENGHDSDCFVFADSASFMVKLTFEQGVTSWTIQDGEGTLIDERDIAVGNVVGSNIFNIMGVLGIAGIVAPAGIAVAESTYYFDIPVMIAAAFACLPIFITGGTISRWEGVLLVGYYAAYTVYIVAAATHHEALSFISNTMLYFVIPITAITLTVMAIQQYRRNTSLK